METPHQMGLEIQTTYHTQLEREAGRPASCPLQEVSVETPSRAAVVQKQEAVVGTLCTHCEHLDSEQGRLCYPMNLRHQGSCHGRTHVSSTHSLRTSSSPHVMAKEHTSTCRFEVCCSSEIALAFSSFLTRKALSKSQIEDGLSIISCIFLICMTFLSSGIQVSHTWRTPPDRVFSVL